MASAAFQHFGDRPGQPGAIVDAHLAVRRPLGHHLQAPALGSTHQPQPHDLIAGRLGHRVEELQNFTVFRRLAAHQAKTNKKAAGLLGRRSLAPSSANGRCRGLYSTFAIGVVSPVASGWRQAVFQLDGGLRLVDQDEGRLRLRPWREADRADAFTGLVTDAEDHVPTNGPMARVDEAMKFEWLYRSASMRDGCSRLAARDRGRRISRLLPKNDGYWRGASPGRPGRHDIGWPASIRLGQGIRQRGGQSGSG